MLGSGPESREHQFYPILLYKAVSRGFRLEMKEERIGRQDWKNGPLLCMKWSGNGASTGCKLEMPWAFKTLNNIGAFAAEHVRQLQRRPKVSSESRHELSGTNLDPVAAISKFESSKPNPIHQFLPQVQGLVSNLRLWGKKEGGRAPVSKDELGELEERALAQALARRKPATIIEFYSPKCTLCRSLAPVVAEVESRYDEWLHIVMVDVDNKKWLPEVLQYDIKYVPCFLLLDSYGCALAKTGIPYSRKHVLQGLMYLLESMEPIGSRVK